VPNAVLDSELYADALVGICDTIRDEIHGALGTRPYKTSIVTRRWSSGRVGEGSYTDTVVQLKPDPEVIRSGGNRKDPGGQSGVNKATLRCVSLTYTEDELYNREKTPGVEVVYMLERQFGGEPNARREFFEVDNSPQPEHGGEPGDRIGWRIDLHEVESFGSLNGSDA